MRCVYYIVSLLSVSQSGETSRGRAGQTLVTAHPARTCTRDDSRHALEVDTRGARRGRALRSLTLCRVLSKLPVSGSPAARSPTLRVRLCATVRALYLRYTRDQSVLYHQHHASHHRHRAYSILRAGRRRFRYGYNVSPLSVSCYRPQCESEYPNQLTLLTYSTYLDH